MKKEVIKARNNQKQLWDLQSLFGEVSVLCDALTPCKEAVEGLLEFLANKMEENFEKKTMVWCMEREVAIRLEEDWLVWTKCQTDHLPTVVVDMTAQFWPAFQEGEAQKQAKELLNEYYSHDARKHEFASLDV